MSTETVAKTEPGADAVPVSAGKSALWLVAIGLGALIVSLAQSLLIPVLPSLPKQLDVPFTTVQWLLTSTLLAGAVAFPVLGRLGDMWGRRRMLLVAVAAMVVGSVITALTNSIPVLIIGRSLQGVASAAIPLGISLLATLLPKERRAASMAVISAMLGVGGALGLPFAGLITLYGDFHTLFWITAIAAAVAFVVIIFAVPEPSGAKGGQLDVLGMLLLVGALVALLLPLSEGATWGWDSPAVLILAGVSVVLFVLLGFWEAHFRSPLVDLKALRSRPLLFTNIASLFIGFALFASLIGTANYVEMPRQTGYGFGSSTLEAGLSMLPAGLAMLVISPLAARLINTVGAHWSLMIGGLVITLGWLSRIILTANLAEVIIGSTIVGIGTSIGFAAVPTLISAHTPRAELAVGNALNALVRSLGSSLASAIGGALLATMTITLGGVALPSLAGFQVLFAICGGAALIAGVIAIFVPERARGVHAA